MEDKRDGMPLTVSLESFPPSVEGGTTANPFLL